MHATRPLLLLFCVAGLFLKNASTQTPFDCKGQLFLALTTGTSYALHELTLDVSTDIVQATPVQEQITGNVNAIGFNPNDRLIYGYDYTSSYLFRVDANGQAETLKKISLDPDLGYFGGDVTPDGHYLVIIGGGRGPDLFNDVVLVVVELTAPDFPFHLVPLQGAYTRTYDIAFDPHSGILYGFDVIDKRLTVIDPVTGQIHAPFPSYPVANFIGGLFFDPFGNLFGYGNTSGVNKNTLFRLDKNTGEIKAIASGPEAFGTDGCACPYTVDLQELVSPPDTVGCSVVRYTLRIVNASGRSLDGVSISEVWPPGFTLQNIVYQPFDGIIESGVGSSAFFIKNITLPQGQDSIVIEVAVEDVEDGIYSCQAALFNLPPELGSIRIAADARRPPDRSPVRLNISGSACAPDNSEPPSVFAPNVFSPNGDGINDRFFLQTKEPLLIQSFAVYSRWGEQVCETLNASTNDPEAGWDGFFKNKQAAAGMYTWKAVLEFPDGQARVLSGTVAVLR